MRFCEERKAEPSTQQLSRSTAGREVCASRGLEVRWLCMAGSHQLRVYISGVEYRQRNKDCASKADQAATDPQIKQEVTGGDHASPTLTLFPHPDMVRALQ